MPKLLATTIVNDAQSGESHGGAFMLDLEAQTIDKVIHWDKTDIEWFGHEGSRGLRGIEFDGERVYIAAGDELLAFSPGFEPLGCWRNPYLKNCHGISIYQRNLFLASSDLNSILAFDLDEQKFHWAIHIDAEQFNYKARIYDPAADDGPLALNKLQIEKVYASGRGMHISGGNTGGILHFNGQEIRMSVELPEGSHDARFYRNGVVFNDSRDGVLRFTDAGEGKEDRAMRVPLFDAADHLRADPVATRIMKPGYARGLCIISDTVVAGGSSPSTISVYDLAANKKVLSTTFSKDPRSTIHSIALWPFD